MRFHEQVAAEKVAAADAEVAEAQAKAAQVRADQLRAEFAPTSVPARASQPGAGEWVAHPDVPKGQQYVRKDGSMSYRGRDGGKVSQGFDTEEEMKRWLAGDRTPKVSPERAAELDALASEVMADTR